jgi:hypothetical protein
MSFIFGNGDVSGVEMTFQGCNTGENYDFGQTSYGG